MTQRLAMLPAQRRARFLARLREHADAVARRGPTSRGNTGPAPLSQAQTTLRSLDRLTPGASTAGIPLCLRLRGELDAETLRSALAALAARHESLRTAIVPREGRLMQVIAPQVRVELPLIAADGDDHGRRLAAARAEVRARTRTAFDLTRTPIWRAALIEAAPDDHLLLLDMPRILCDAWSQDIMLGELGEFYRSLREGDVPNLPELPVQFPDYAAWQRDQLDSGGQDRLDRSAAYWHRTLAGAEVLEFPADRPRGDARAEVCGSATYPVGQDALHHVRELAREQAASPSDVLLAAFLTLVQRYCGLDDLVIGTPDANRRHEAVASMVGRLADMRVLRVDVSGDPTFRELVKRVRSVSDEASEHDGPPLDEEVPFSIVFGVEDDAAIPVLPGLVVTRESVPTGISGFDMTWRLTTQTASGTDATLTIDFDPDMFDAETIARLARHYDTLLRALTIAPDSPVSAAEMLSPADRELLHRAAVGPIRPIRESTIVAEFETRVREAPDSIAVVAGGVETSYADLNARANRLAALLRERGVQPGDRVGLCLRRNLDLPTAILAVLKTGAAYVPLDTTHPPARVAEIAADARVSAVIAHEAVGRALSEVEAPIVTLDAVRDVLAALPAADPPLAAAPGDVAYVIYTSGSTGKPKGVLLEHRGVVNFIDSTRELFELTPADRVLGFASATFDVSVFETFSALLTGARLCLAADEERLSIDRLQALMETAGVTVIDLPPTVMPLLTPERFTGLRIAFVGGEAFGGELVNRWNPGRRLFNGYGPTECTVTMIVEECAGTWDASPPIGLPMANHVAHVLDSELRRVPVGVPGELVIGGAGLARGYLDREELTAEKFIPDPFGTAPGGRLYRTGDLVKRLPDGRLVFLGRLDQQVKIRGLRIELGEVESAVGTFAGVGPVSVRPWTDDAGAKHLVCYVTGVGEDQVPALREHLGAVLPAYMIPSFFVVLAELPLTSSGKVDWRRLPEPDPSQSGAGPVEQPRTTTERVLLHDILAPLLRTSRLGVRDDFFLAGGNSLQAVQVMSVINRRFGVEISLGDFFVSPTVAHLASVIDEVRGSRRAGDGSLDALAALSGAKDDGRAPVMMRDSGPAHVILLHPSGGELFCYVPLVRALRADIGVTGFSADPRDAAVDPDEAMATSAARIVRTLAADGLPSSCCLVGWSYGGVLAFEVARQIEQETGERPAVVLLDAAYDEDAETLTEPTVRQRFVHDVARLAGHDAESVRAVLDVADVADIGQTLEALGVELELTKPELAARYETFRSCALSMQAYRPPAPYGGPVTVLTASQSADTRQQWRAFSTGPFQAESVPGDHYTLFTRPALDRVVAAVEATLGR